jgi:ectoine hydroxylase-related dioxygenase (phytanoyl-CoA dioxygenase family)
VLTRQPLRPITESEVDTFWRDGVVCLRQVIGSEWLERMAVPFEDALATAATTDLSAMGDELERAGAVRVVDEAVRTAGIPRGHFLAGTDHWRSQPEFLEFAVRSPLGAIVARLLRSDRVWFYEDSVLVKEPGSQERTAFHQDMAYFHLDGDQVCTTWVPLDPVTAETGAVRFVAGSHQDRTTKYRPNMFVTTTALPGTEGVDVPDYDQQVGAARIISFDTQPGDITVHHARTIHGAYANGSTTQRRRAISVRFAGDDTVFAPVANAFPKPHHSSMQPGQPLDNTACPLAWPQP